MTKLGFAMNTFQELLTTKEYVFLTSISDAGDQELHARLCLGGHNPLPRAIIGKKGADLLAKPIEYTNAHYVDVLWKRYLQFSVCDECVARIIPGQQYEGRCVRLYSQSRLLSSLDEISNGTHVLRGEVKHFGLACMNHFVDVLAYEEPEVIDLGSRPISFGQPLRPRAGSGKNRK